LQEVCAGFKKPSGGPAPVDIMVDIVLSAFDSPVRTVNDTYLVSINRGQRPERRIIKRLR
jgi:hypothetical protein